MMGLNAKSSTKDYFLNDLGSTPLFEYFLFHLAMAFTQLANTRLTKKQRHLLFATRQALRYHPNLSHTALADYLARKLNLPLSTTKFNLKVLKDAGLLDSKPTNKRRTTASLSFGGQLLTHLLPKPNME